MMTQKRFTSRAIALAVALTVLQVYVQAALSDDATKASPATAQAGQSLKGRLTTRGNNPVTVNGNSAKSGATIFSGQQIQTPAGVGATVQLPGLGRLDIAPNANVTVTFENGKINVAVTSGCVILTAERGTTGTVTAQGTTQQTDPAKGGAIDICTNPAGGAPVIGQGAAGSAGAGAAGTGGAAAGTAAGSAGGLFGLGMPATLAFSAIVGATTAAIIASNRPACVPRGANPSPGTPRGPCE
jgi:hypothetical protein